MTCGSGTWPGCSRSQQMRTGGLVSPEVGIWLDRIDGEIANLRAALELARETGRPNALLALVTRTGNYWYTRGLWREAQGWVEDGLERVEPDRSADRAKALASATVYALVLGDLDAAGTYGDEALSIYRELGDDEGVGWLLNMLGLARQSSATLDEAELGDYLPRVQGLRAQGR